MKTYSFEKLQVWQHARGLAKNIYLITKQFPDDERFGLTSQLRRASVSVCSNLAEGSSRNSYKDKVSLTIQTNNLLNLNLINLNYVKNKNRN